jgi:hypothetical protein
VHFLAAHETDAFKRNAHLDVVAFLGKLARAVPHPIRRDVFTGSAACQNITLYSTRIDEHVVRALTVAHAIKAESHPIIVPHAIPSAHSGLYLCRFRVYAAKSEIEIVLVISGPHFGALL